MLTVFLELEKKTFKFLVIYYPQTIIFRLKPENAWLLKIVEKANLNIA